MVVDWRHHFCVREPLRHFSMSLETGLFERFGLKSELNVGRLRGHLDEEDRAHD